MKYLLNTVFVLAMLWPGVGCGHDFEVDGIYYQINGEGVAVTYRGDDPDGYGAYSGDVVIPETVTHDGITYWVTAVGNSAFDGCWELMSIELPNSVTSIGESAFSSCGIECIEVPNSVTAIGDYAFYNSRLEDILLSNAITSIGDNTFQWCGLTSIDIPNSVIAIGDFAFADCWNLTSVVIPDSVTTIGYAAFGYCPNLASIEIPNSVTSIGALAFDGTAWYERQPDGLVYAGLVAYQYKGTMPNGTSLTLKRSTLGIADDAFFGCTVLTSAVIPNSVTIIGNHAFKGCTGLTGVTIGRSVTVIKKGAFEHCHLMDVVCYATIPPACGENTFTDYSGTLHVPAASLAAYQTASCWRNFADIVGDAVECGDVNMDGSVNIGDVTALINYLLSHDATCIDLANADVDHDGKATINDVTTLINYLLSAGK